MGSKKLKTDKKLKNHIKYEGFKVGLPVPVEEMKRPLSFRNRVIMELSRKLNKLGVPPLSITREAYKVPGTPHHILQFILRRFNSSE